MIHSGNSAYPCYISAIQKPSKPQHNCNTPIEWATTKQGPPKLQRKQLIFQNLRAALVTNNLSFLSNRVIQ